MATALPATEVLPPAERYQPDAAAYEAFSLANDAKGWTRLCEPLRAATLAEALAETTSRWSWDRGQRLGIREITAKADQLHVYAVRRKAQGVRPNVISNLEYARWLEHICTIDMDVIAGIDRRGVGVERTIHLNNQQRRPAGARLFRDASK